MPAYKIHKYIVDSRGRKTCACQPSNKQFITCYHWSRVTCSKCLQIKELGLSDKQTRELARKRLENSPKEGLTIN